MLINAKVSHWKNENDCPHRLTGWELAGLIQKRDAVISDSFLETSAQQQPKNCHQAIYTPVAQKVQDQAGWKARFKKIRSYKHGFKQFWSFTLAEENARIKIIIIIKKSICPCQKSIMWSEKHMENKRLCIINYKIAFSHLRANTSVFFLNPDISNG